MGRRPTSGLATAPGARVRAPGAPTPWGGHARVRVVAGHVRGGSGAAVRGGQPQCSDDAGAGKGGGAAHAVVHVIRAVYHTAVLNTLECRPPLTPTVDALVDQLA